MKGIGLSKRGALLLGALLALLLAGVLPRPALGDDPPPITVPTPTVPAPTPDTAPKPAPAPRYRPTPTRPTPTRTYAPPKYTPAPSYPIVRHPARPAVRKPVATAKRPTTPKKHPVVPIVPIRQQSTRTRDRETFRPGAPARAPVQIKHPVAPKSSRGSPLTWLLPLAIALLVGAALAVAGRSRRVRAHLPQLTPQVRRLLALAEPARPRIARALRFIAASPRRLLPPELAARAPARLPHVSFDSLRHTIEQRAAAVVESRRPTEGAAAVVRMPQPAVARLEPVATVEARPEPEFAAAILSPPPPSTVAEITAPAPPTDELCEIALWRGYTKTRFYARLDVSARAEDEGSAVAESPAFRFSGNGTPAQTEAAEDAHRALVDELMTRGWEPCESTGPWYADRFSRPLVAPG